MKASPIKTHKITIQDTNLLQIIDQYVEQVPENSVLAVTSKIVSLTQGRVVEKDKKATKKDLVPHEAELYTDPAENKYGASIAITHGKMIGSAGIDGGNTDGYYVMLPEHIQQVTNNVRDHIRKKCNVNNIGVMVVDSTSMPFQWGPLGIALSYSGFVPFQVSKGTDADVFDRTGSITRYNILGGLAASATLVMGESDEQQPIALLSELDFVNFVDHHPTESELKDMKISMEDDLFHHFWEKVEWKKGKKYKETQ